MLDLRAIRPLLRSPAALILVVLAVSALLGTGGRVLHIHEDQSAGYYNEQHVLESLAALSTDAPLAAAPPAAVVEPVTAPAPVALDPFAPAVVVRRSDSRAPPSA